MTNGESQYDGVDPLLVDPARLFVVSLLCSTEWCRFGFVYETTGLSKSAMSRHVARLRSEGYVITTMGIYGRTWIKLTALGLDRFACHVAALEGIVAKASGLVARARQAAGTLDDPEAYWAEPDTSGRTEV